MAGKKDYNYSNFGSSPYDSLLNRAGDLNYQFGGMYMDSSREEGVGSGSNDGTTQTKGGSVATVALKSEGNATDVWIQNYIRSVNWKPKKVGFYIDGSTGYAEFANIYVSGTIVVTTGQIGGFEIGSGYIRDSLDTMGISSEVTGDDDVRFWAGDSYDNRAIAPFRVLESGKLYATYVVISGGVIDGGTIAAGSLDGSTIIDGTVSGDALVPGTLDGNSISNGSVNNSKLKYPPLSGSGAPTSVPESLGQLYIDTSASLTQRAYIAVGTDSDIDWVRITTTAVNTSRSVSESELITITEDIALAII